MGRLALALWKRELRRRGRYVPYYSPEKLAYYQIEHERNIRFCMSGYEHFRKLTRNTGYSAWVAEEHDEYERLQTRNHIPREIGEYKNIINDPWDRCFRSVHSSGLLLLRNGQRHRRIQVAFAIKERSSKEREKHRIITDSYRHFEFAKHITH